VIQRHAFESMGTDVEFLLVGDERAENRAVLWAAEAEMRRLETMLTRFDPDSELSRLNRDKVIEASPELLKVTQLALVGREQTGGRFDPTVHDALVAAGYDRTFAEVPTDGQSAPTGELARCGGSVTINLATRTVALEADTSLDFGGIAKGYAVDQACGLLSGAGACLVNAGGDLAVHGLLDGDPWPVGIETATETITIGLERGAVATSGRDRRRWLRGGRELHHIIDPATGWPAETDLLRVSVVAATSCEGEVLAKAFFLAGEEGARLEADELGVPSVLVTTDGRTVIAGGLA
jgi:FAD:protein FMN transferase